MVAPSIKRFEVWLVDLNPTRGREINKTRPCVVVSPDEMSALATVLMAPMTSKGFAYPCRAACTFKGKKGLILLDHMRAVDKSRLVKNLGSITPRVQQNVCDILKEMFAP